MPDCPTVLSIHVAKATRLPMRSVEEVEAEAGKGLVGDRYHGTRHRHVTVQSRESLDEAAARLGAPIHDSGTRRNVTVSHETVPTVPGTRLPGAGVRAHPGRRPRRAGLRPEGPE